MKDVKKDIVILLGPPSSGKGTQSSLIAEKFGYLGISTGDLLRKEKKSGSDLGKHIASLIDSGKLVSDELVFQLLVNELNNSKCNGFILDGYPRTVEQAYMLDAFLSDQNSGSNFKIKKVLVIDLTKEIILKRIFGRLTCPNCSAIYNVSFKKPQIEGICDVCKSKLTSRNDDLNVDSINNRIDIFLKNIISIKDFYKKQDLLFSIDGNNTIDNIHAEIVNILKN